VSADTFSDIMAWIILGFACFSPGLFCIAVGLGIWCFRLLRLKCQALESELETAQESVRRLREENDRLALEEWFRSAADAQYRNEIEVEVKFIYPLLRFLGYSSQSVSVRVPVEVYVGRQQVKGEADWVLWDKLTDPSNPRAIAVIEAKAYTQSLGDQVQSQARSYAFGLNASTYAVTNGQRLLIFRRGVQSDDCLVDCTVDDLSLAWPVIQEALGPAG